MKRILFCVLLSFVTYSARAESWMLFSAAAVEDSINTMVEPEYRAATADEYEKQMDSTTGKITASGILSVCATAGWAINTDEGFYFCRGFVDNIAELSGVSSNAAKQCKQMNGIRTVLDDGSNQCIGRDGTVLVYSDACRGGDGECVEFFADLRTQVPNALEFIYEYGKSNNLKFTCSNEIVDIHKIGSDYIKCSANKTAYEFKFDTLNQSYNRRMVDSENAALCKMFGGTVAGTDDYWTMCDMERAKCDKLATFAPTIGHSAMYQGSCRISRTVNTRDNIFLNHIDGVDSYVFYDVKIRSGVAKPMLEQYLTSIFPDEEYITCDSDIVELNDPTSLGTNWIMQCTVGTQQVDFIFDELTTQSDAQTMTGMDIMQCIINGGTFNGETCRGLTATECDALDAKLRASGSENGAYYDDDMRACVLGNAMATYQRNVVTGYVIGAVVIVGGTVLTIASGGAAAPVVINGVAMLAGDLAINYTIDANHRRLSEKAAKKFVDFVTDADACTTEQCALDVLEKHYATLSGVMSDLNTDDRAVVDETMDRLIGLIQTEFVACGKNDAGQTVYASPADCAMQQSKLTLLDHIDPYSEVALIIGSVIYDPGYVVARFTRLKNVTKVADKITDVVDGVKSATRATSKVDDVYNAKLVAAYNKYAPKNQTFDDFKKMFANEAEFEAQMVAWQSFEAKDYQFGEYFWDKKFIPTPYSTFDPELNAELKAIDSRYADDIADLNIQIDDIEKQETTLRRIEEDKIKAERDAVERLAKERIGHYPSRDDWDSPELQDLKTRYESIESRLDYRNKVYTPEELALQEQKAPLENLRDGYVIARDYEKSKIINSGIPEDVAQSVVNKRRQELVDIIAKDDKLFNQMQDFSNLSIDDKQQFLQNVHDALDEKTNIDPRFRVVIYEEPESSIVGNAVRQYNIKPLGKDLDINEVLNTIVHEQSHSVDSDVPDIGMLGSQAANVDIKIGDMTTQWENTWNWNTMQPQAKRLKLPEIYEVYVTNPTEYSSFKVGDVEGGFDFVESIIEQRKNIAN